MMDSEMADMTDVCDRLQDNTRELSKLTKAVLAQPAPVVNVSAPQVRAPDVNVSVPSASPAAVTVNEAKRPLSAESTVIERDGFGRIQKVKTTFIY